MIEYEEDGRFLVYDGDGNDGVLGKDIRVSKPVCLKLADM